MFKKIILLGAPGSGKGMRIKWCMTCGFVPISSGDLLRNAGYDISSGELVQDSIVFPIVMDAINQTQSDVILDGFPRCLSQAEELERRGHSIDKVIYLKINNEDVIIYRALNRLICSKCQSLFTKDSYRPPKVEGLCDVCGGKLISRADDKEETVRHRFKIFNEKTLPILDFYKYNGVEIIEIDAETSLPEDIVNII